MGGDCFVVSVGGIGVKGYDYFVKCYGWGFCCGCWGSGVIDSRIARIFFGMMYLSGISKVLKRLISCESYE